MKIKSKMFFIVFVLWVSMFVTLGTEATMIETINFLVTDTANVMETTPTLGADGVSRIVVYTSQEYDPVNDVYKAGIIYAQRLNTSEVVPPLMQVGVSNTDNQFNDISGSLVVYTSFTDSALFIGEIHLIDLNDGHIPDVLSGQGMVRESRIHGDMVVWIETISGKSRVVLKDLNSGTGPMIISDASTQLACNLQIGDTFVVWEVKVDDRYDVVAYDLHTKELYDCVATNPMYEQYPSTSGTWVTWEERVSDTVSKILAVDLDGADPSVVVTDDEGFNRCPTIDGDIIVYEALVDDEVNGQNYDIFIYRISTGETFPIITGSGDQIMSNVYGDQVAYVYNDDIFVTTFSFDSGNLPPEITSINGPLDPVALGTTYEMTGTFIDPDDGDMHTASWDWGDDTTSSGMVELDNTVTGSHDYDVPGVYTITLTITDSSGESDTETWPQYVVIYDPSDGFVTGGGWIDSPEGAYLADPDLSGKANFGFVSKYKKGSNIPTGNTEFQFHAGDLNFRSGTYDWLVIAGAKAMFKGIGTINGEGSYKFMITAIDGALLDGDGVDKFRIKIWLEDELTGEEIIIYDNMLGTEDDIEMVDNTEIGGGSIKIHKG